MESFSKNFESAFEKISFTVKEELKEMDNKLVEVESNLKSKENDNLELCSKLARMEHELSVAAENQKELAEENKRLKLELETRSTSLEHNEINKVILKYEESKAESQIYSNQLDLLEENASDLERENKTLLLETKSLRSTLRDINQINEEKQIVLENANREIYELKQLVSLLEFVVEETSTQNLTLQKKCNELYNRRSRKSEHDKPNQNGPRNVATGPKSTCFKVKATDEAACNSTKQTTEDISQKRYGNLSFENNDIIVGKPHCAVYLGIFMKSGRFPCKCGKDFGTKQELKIHIGNENGKAVQCSDCARTFASNDEMECHRESFHKQAHRPKLYHKF